MKILIVDDEQLARERLHRQLDELNEDYEIIEADNGLAAIEQSQKYNPEIGRAHV